MKNKIFKKIINIARPAFIIGFISGIFRLFSSSVKFFAPRKRKERRHNFFTLAMCICAVLSALAGVGATLLFFVKKRRGGYLFDIFDTDYNAVDDENEQEIKCRVKSELNSDCDTGGSNRTTREVPYDIDATAENLG